MRLFSLVPCVSLLLACGVNTEPILGDGNDSGYPGQREGRPADAGVSLDLPDSAAGAVLDGAAAPPAAEGGARFATDGDAESADPRPVHCDEGDEVPEEEVPECAPGEVPAARAGAYQCVLGGSCLEESCAEDADCLPGHRCVAEDCEDCVGECVPEPCVPGAEVTWGCPEVESAEAAQVAWCTCADDGVFECDPDPGAACATE